MLLFGLDLIDIEAVDQLDEIMTKPKEDYFYLRKRKNTIIIGVAEHSISVPIAAGDLILEKINENEYRAISLTENGEKIVKNKFLKRKKSGNLNLPGRKKRLKGIGERFGIAGGGGCLVLV